MLEIPNDWWTLLPEGKVNIRNETLFEWLGRLRRKYEPSDDTRGNDGTAWSVRIQQGLSGMKKRMKNPKD